MTHTLPRLKASEVVTVLERNGFIRVTQRGSHQKWRNADTVKQVIVPYHEARQLPLGTVRSIIDGSGIPQDEFLKHSR